MGFCGIIITQSVARIFPLVFTDFRLMAEVVGRNGPQAHHLSWFSGELHY
jgi:hypothetical protein